MSSPSDRTARPGRVRTEEAPATAEGIAVADGKPATAERIEAAAREELELTGRLTVNGVAARAGLSRQAVYYHFGGLPGLRAAVDPDARQAGTSDTRARILDAARRVLSRPGAGATIDDIALEAGLTKGAVYHHFADRATLLRAVADLAMPTDRDLLPLSTTDGLTDVEALAVLLRTYHQAIGARADLVRNLVIASGHDPELVAVMARAMITRLAPTLLGWYRHRASVSGFRDVHPSLVFQALFGPVFAQIVFGPFLDEVLAEVGGRPVAEVAEEYADLLLTGLSAGGPGEIRRP
jgi:AcrR family transcriptional regulator